MAGPSKWLVQVEASSTYKRRVAMRYDKLAANDLAFINSRQ